MGLIQITDPFLNPDGSQWTGTIIYTLLYPTTVDGATIVGAQQAIQVSNGISIQLAPGLYTVQLNQSGLREVITEAWGVPFSGGPYTVAQIQGNITLQGGFGSVTLTGTPSAGQVPTATGPTAATWQGATLQSNTVEVLNAAMLQLDTVPVTLLPALGPGKISWPIRLLCQQKNAFYVSGSQLLELAFGTLGANTGVGSFGFLRGNGNANDIDTVYLPGTLNGEAALYENLPLIGFADGPVTQPDGAGGNVYITTWYLEYELQ